MELLRDLHRAGWQDLRQSGSHGPGHLLYDSRTNRLTGVVDFGSAGPGDPAIDFAALSSAPEPFLAGLAWAYPLAAQVDDRIRFYRGTFALQDALFGIEQGDETAFRAGIASYVDCRARGGCDG